ncbi:hypothetical protein ACOME3_008769 [Neoechinorhynchus agilis]
MFSNHTRLGIIYFTLATIYFLWFALAVGFGIEHAIVFSVVTALFWFGRPTRKLLASIAPYILYAGLYDSMKAIPNYDISYLRIREIYDIEKRFFGVQISDLVENATIANYKTVRKVTLNELSRVYYHPIPMVICGLFYINWISVPASFAIYLYLTYGGKWNRSDSGLIPIKTKRCAYLKFSLHFLLVNIAGFIIYYCYPAAPPWYIEIHGFKKHLDVPGHAGSLLSRSGIVSRVHFLLQYHCVRFNQSGQPDRLVDISALVFQ